MHVSWLMAGIRQRTLDFLLDVLMPRRSAD